LNIILTVALILDINARSIATFLSAPLFAFRECTRQ